MTLPQLWFLGLAALPLAVVVASLVQPALELARLRRMAIACAGLLVALASLVLVRPELADVEIPWPGISDGPSMLRTDALSAALVPVAAALWLLTVAVTPRTRLDRAGLRRTALATLVTMAAFSTESPELLVVLCAGSVGLYLAALGGDRYRHARRVAALYLGASTVLLLVGVTLLTTASGLIGERVGLWLIVGAALIRKGIFPFHAWSPELFERGPLGPAVLFAAPQLGAYLTVVLIVPRAGPEMLRTIAILALLTALYGASLALVQRDARRALGYLFISQSALVMAGLDCTSELALSGALVLWISSALAFAGISRCVLVLEARRGRLDLSKFHGGYEQTPMLAISFLVLGLACTGFPGTLGFIGEELLVDGATESFPLLGFLVVATGALTGLAVLRMYISLFTGRHGDPLILPARRNEKLVFAGLALVLIAAGLRPDAVVRSRIEAAGHIVDRRDEHVGREASELPSGPHAQQRKPVE